MTEVSFVDVDRFGAPTGLAVPQEFYAVLDGPAPLAGMSHPTTYTPWNELASHGFMGIVRLESRTELDPAPLDVIHSTQLQDLYGGGFPDDAAQEAALVASAVSAVVGELIAERGVIVHCAGGTGRTGCVIAGALVSLGVAPADAIGRMNSLHQSRGRQGWPESEWQASVIEALG